MFVAGFEAYIYTFATRFQSSIVHKSAIEHCPNRQVISASVQYDRWRARMYSTFRLDNWAIAYGNLACRLVSIACSLNHKQCLRSPIESS
jgi:hypothetical protein